MGAGKMAKDTLVLTAAALMMRLLALAFQSWLAQRIGAEGLGLWQLVLSVNVFSATLAISGIRFTATRLVSEELGRRGGGDAGGAVARCLLYAVSFGCAACLLTYFGAAPIGFLWIGDARTVPCLRIFAFTLPLISVGSVLNGVFIARRQAWKSAAVQTAEQCAGIGFAVLLLRGVPGGDIAAEAAALARGNLMADALTLILALSLYLLAPPGRARRRGKGLAGRMLHIALPLALSAYARTGLSTLEHLLVPRMLRRSGLSSAGALSGYGTVTGMVFPLISFPACLLVAAAELTVPELTAAQVRGDLPGIRLAVRRRLRFAAAYSLAVALFLLLSADALADLVYHDASAGPWIRLLAPLVPVMYLDIVTDGCLKGLGQMLRSMSVNVGEAMIGLLLALTLLPRFALTGYAAMLYLCELWNFGMSFALLRKITGLRLLPRARKNAGRPEG